MGQGKNVSLRKNCSRNSGLIIRLYRKLICQQIKQSPTTIKMVGDCFIVYLKNNNAKAPTMKQ